MTDPAGSIMVSESRQVPTLLEQAPRSVADLPAYFAALDADRLKRVWVSLIIEAVESRLTSDAGFIDEEPSMDPHWSIAQLSAALRAIRDHGDNPVPLPPPGKRGTKTKTERTPGSSKALVELALRSAKERGEVRMRAVIGHGGTCAELRRQVDAGLHPGFRIIERRGHRGGRPMLILAFTGEGA